MPFPWIKNTKGEPSASLTMAVIAFLTVTSWLVVWVLGTALGFKVPPFDAASAMTFLTPVLTLYFGRRYTNDVSDKKIKLEMQKSKKNEPNVA